MSTPLSDILSLVAAHGKSQASAFLQGEAVIGGSPDQEIWEHLARHDILWDGLTVADQDQIRDSYLEAFKQECARRLTVANRTETTSEASSVVPDPLVPEVVKEALEKALAHLTPALPHLPLHEPAISIRDALTALRSYSPAPSPSVELLRELRTNSSILLEAMEARTDDFTIREFLTWGCVSRLRATLTKLNAALA